MKLMKNGRKDLSFNLKDNEQKNAFDFLNKLGRQQSAFLTILINNFLTENFIENANHVKEDEAKELAKNIIIQKKLNLKKIESLLHTLMNNVQSTTQSQAALPIYEEPILSHFTPKEHPPFKREESPLFQPEESMEEYLEESEDDSVELLNIALIKNQLKSFY